MVTLPRIIGDDIHYHIILRCNNKERLFAEETDFNLLYQMLGEAKIKFGFRLYNYEFLNSHVHLMLSTHEGNFINQIMHDICLKYAKDYNQRYQRSGHFWAHRYRSRIILNDQHGLACLRYQHRNTLSAGLVSKPEDWQWSGYCHYAFGSENDLLEPHPSYLSLSEDLFQRRKIYRGIVNTLIPSDKIPNLLEKGNGKLTWRFIKMVRQVERLRRQSLIKLHIVTGTVCQPAILPECNPFQKLVKP